MAIKVYSPEQISRMIRESRKSLGISQKRLAKMCNMSQSSIARIETDMGSMNPSYQSIFYIAEALDRLAATPRREIMNRPAAEIMHRRIISIKPDSTILDAIEVFKDYDFPQLPVIDASRHVVGTVYQKDILNAATQSPDMVGRRTVSSIMRGSLPQVDRHSEITGLKPILESAGAVIVINKGKAVGIITIYDILKTV